MNVPCPACGGAARRETETMDTFVDSSWYFLRYCDPGNAKAPFDRAIVDYWNPVDLYIGGVDHATMHMIYARFWVKVLNDLGLVGFREPFASFFSNGWVTVGKAKISKRSGKTPGPTSSSSATAPTPSGSASSSSAPPTRTWSGPRRPSKGWRASCGGCGGSSRGGRDARRRASARTGALARKAHATIAKATDDIGRRFAFNTAISAVMELVNELSRDTSGPGRALRRRDRGVADPAVRAARRRGAVAAARARAALGAPWPVADEALLERDTFELVVQVNGKVRDRIEVAASLSDDELVERAKASPKVQAHVDGKAVRQAIVVPRKLVNLVVG